MKCGEGGKRRPGVVCEEVYGDLLGAGGEMGVLSGGKGRRPVFGVAGEVVLGLGFCGWLWWWQTI